MLFWTQKIKDHSKKKTRAYKEQDEEKRVDYERAMSVYKKENIVYVDESGIDRRLHRRNARSAKGKEGDWLCGREEEMEAFSEQSNFYRFLGCRR
jgi:hypothetical protein